MTNTVRPRVFEMCAYMILVSDVYPDAIQLRDAIQTDGTFTLNTATGKQVLASISALISSGILTGSPASMAVALMTADVDAAKIISLLTTGASGSVTYTSIPNFKVETVNANLEGVTSNGTAVLVGNSESPHFHLQSVAPFAAPFDLQLQGSDHAYVSMTVGLMPLTYNVGPNGPAVTLAIDTRKTFQVPRGRKLIITFPTGWDGVLVIQSEGFPSLRLLDKFSNMIFAADPLSTNFFDRFVGSGLLERRFKTVGTVQAQLNLHLKNINYNGAIQLFNPPSFPVTSRLDFIYEDPNVAARPELWDKIVFLTALTTLATGSDDYLYDDVLEAINAL